MKHRANPEAQIQRAVFEHLRLRGAPGLFAWHPFSGGFRRPVEAAIFKGLGARAGLPDVLILYRGQLYGIGLKSEAGKLTDIQRDTIDAMQSAGAICCVVHGLNEALHWLEVHELLRGRVA